MHERPIQVAAVAAIFVIFAAPALADEEICDGVFSGGSFEDDVAVPDGATCTLDGTRVKGNLKVLSGGALVATGARLRNDLQAKEARYLQILNTRIAGNVQLDATSDVPPSAAANQVCGSKIGGDLQLVENRAPFEIGCDSGNQVKGNLQISQSEIADGTIVVTNNRIRGDLQYQANTTSAGADLSNNRVRQNLQCTDNEPPPMGAGNTAGDADGQCSQLATEGRRGGSRTVDLDVCNGVFGKEKFDDVTVPDGATCTLNGTRVKGNVLVQSGGVLVATDARVKGNVQVESGGALDATGVKVRGNIQTDEATDVRVRDARVGGDVQILATTGTPPDGGPNQVCGSRIKSNLQATGNTAPIELGCADGNKVGGNLQVQDSQIAGQASEIVIAVANNKVRGDLQFDDNAGGDAEFDISGNRIGQNLQCADNTPPPMGSGNRVGGDVDGQCSGLAN